MELDTIKKTIIKTILILMLITITLNSTHAEDIGTFTELQNLIDNTYSGNIELQKDYVYNNQTDTAYKNGVIIKNSVNINGNNHTLDGKGQAGILTNEIKVNSIILNNITFTNPGNQFRGEAIYTISPTTISNSNFYNAYNNYSRASVISAYSTLNLISCLFINNTNTYDMGGRIVHGATITIINSKFYNNTGTVAIIDTAKGYIYNSTFINNDGGRYGGVIYAITGGIQVVENSTFINNNATLGGVFYGPIHEVYHSTFINNTATNGGVLYYSHYGDILGSFKWESNTFINNTAKENGGAIYSDIYFKASGNIFLDNTAKKGKDIYLLYSGTDNNLDGNWWGENTPFTDTNRIIIANKTYTPNKWIILSANFADDYLIVNSETEVIVSLNKLYNKNTGNTEESILTIPKRYLEYLDFINYQEILDKQTSYKFTPTTEGTFNIKLKVDNEDLDVPFTVISGITDLSLEITTVDNKLNYYVTDIVEFILTLKNNGNPAIRVNTSFKLPEGLTYLDDTGDGTYNSDAGTWYLKSIPDGTTETINIRAKLTNYGTYTINSKIESANTDTNHENNKDTITINAEKIVDLKLTITTVDIPYGIRYILNVTNEGKTSVTGVYVDCPIPSGLRYRNHTGETFNKDTGIWTIGNMGENDEKTLSIDTYIDSESLITSDFTLHLNENDIHPENNKATLEINPSTDLLINAEFNETTVYVGGIVKYTISATNLGPCTSLNTIVNLKVDNNLEYLSDTSKGAFKDNIWTINTLNIGTTETITIEYKVKTNGTFNIDATLSSTVKERNETNNKISTRIIGISYIDLKLNLTTTESKYSIGERIFFNFELTNLGASNATGLVILFSLPSQLTYINSSDIGEYYTNNRYRGGRYVIFNQLNSGETINFYIQASVSNFTNNTLEITGCAYGDQSEINTENDISTITLELVPAVDLDVSVSNTLINRNRIIYSIDVYNGGDYNASNVELKFNIPDSLKYSSSNPTLGTYQQNTNTWKIGNLGSNNGEKASMTIIFNILKTGEINLKGTINSTDKDTDLINNEFTRTDTISQLNLPVSLNINTPSPTENTNFQVSGTTSAYQGELRITIKDSQNNIQATDTTMVTNAGTFSINFNGLEQGTYTLIADYTDTNKIFTDNTTTINFQVTNPTPITPPSPVNPPITPNTTTIENRTTNIILTTNIINNTLTISGILTEGNNPFTNQEIKIHINNTEYKTITNNNGRFNETINLENGEYILKIEYTGLLTNTIQYQPTSTNRTILINATKTNNTNNTSNTTNTTNISTTPKSIINITDITFIYGQTNKLIGTLTDENQNPLIGHHVSLTLTRTSSGASKTYETTVDYKGEFTLQINLAPGQYTATAKYEGITLNTRTYPPAEDKTIRIQINNQNDANKTTTILETTNQNYVYGNDNKYIGTLEDNNGNPVIGHHVSLTLTRTSSGASKTYDTVVDYKGEFTLQINLAPGEYLIECSYTGINNYQSSNTRNTITITR